VFVHVRLRVFVWTRTGHVVSDAMFERRRLAYAPFVLAPPAPRCGLLVAPSTGFRTEAML